MKKIVALIMLCLLLCAMGAVAFAATVTISDNLGKRYETNITESTYMLPEYDDERFGFTPPPGKAFYGWEVSNYIAYYKPGSTIDVKKNNIQIKAHYIDLTDIIGETIYEVRFISREYNKNNITGYYLFTPGIPEMIFYPYHYGFGTSGENVEKFLYWKVEGQMTKYVPPVPGPDDWGWLYRRALADDFVTSLYPDDLEDYYNVESDLTLTAIWKDSGNPTPPEPQYTVEVKGSEHGTVSVAKNEAKAGESIVITVAPEDGYGLDTLKVSHIADGTQVAVVNNAFVMPGCDVQVEATFVKRNNVIFNANGGSCATGSATVNADNKLVKLPEASRGGYVFKGWFTAAEGGTAVSTDTVFDQAETNVYAQWIKAEHTTNPDENAFHADIALEDLQILDILVSDDDLLNNEDIIVYLTVKELEESKVPSADKDAIIDMAGSDKIAAYLDINLYKKIGNRDAVRISNTKGSKVPIVLKLPEILLPENVMEDSFYIIYYHGDKAKHISASFNTDTRVLSFEADEFSTYSLVYKTQNEEEEAYVFLPKTGDDSMPYVWMLMLLCSVTMMAGIAVCGRKRV